MPARVLLSIRIPSRHPINGIDGGWLQLGRWRSPWSFGLGTKGFHGGPFTYDGVLCIVHFAPPFRALNLM